MSDITLSHSNLADVGISGVMLSILSAVDNDIILGVVIIGLIGLFVSGWRIKSLRPIVPGLMTSLGILGTFWGVLIAMGGFDFSLKEMNDGIKKLLGGMTTAFLTSLLGLFSAIVTKIIFSVKSITSPPLLPGHSDIIGRLEAIKDAISSDNNSSVVTQMQKMRDENMQKEVIDRLDAIKGVIADDNDSSMITQMQKLREENRVGFEKLDGLSEAIRETLVQNLQQLMEDIREIIGKQLGERLEELINGIQEALIKQFGETFVQFNEAVQALKKWQEDHRVQVEELTAAFKETAEGIERIKSDCEQIPVTMESLREIIKSAVDQVEELKLHINAFADMKEKAEQSFPTIKGHLDEIGEDLKSSAEGFKQVETIVTEAMQKFNNEINSELNRLAKAWGENMISIAEAHAAEVERARQNIDNNSRRG